MTTQLQNQDPFAPMENGDFIAQMAQFSTVTGITEMGQSLKGIADQLGEFRIATAANLLGSSVMLPGSTARADENGEIHGMLDLPSASGITNLAFKDANGTLLHTIELGTQPAGLVGFSWMDVPSDIVDSGDAIRIEAYADMGNGMESLTPNVFAGLAASTGDDLPVFLTSALWRVRAANRTIQTIERRLSFARPVLPEIGTEFAGPCKDKAFGRVKDVILYRAYRT